MSADGVGRGRRTWAAIADAAPRDACRGVGMTAVQWSRGEWLQWGRDITAADTPTACHFALWNGLQWSRDITAADTASAALPGAGDKLLQLRIPLDLGAHSVATWAAVPVHLGARSERSDEWMVRLTLRWPRNRFPSSFASTVPSAPRRGRCARGGRRSRRRSSDLRTLRANFSSAAAK